MSTINIPDEDVVPELGQGPQVPLKFSFSLSFLYHAAVVSTIIRVEKLSTQEKISLRKISSAAILRPKKFNRNLGYFLSDPMQGLVNSSPKNGERVVFPLFFSHGRARKSASCSFFHLTHLLLDVLLWKKHCALHQGVKMSFFPFSV